MNVLETRGYLLGVDLGQASDYTALAVLRHIERRILSDERDEQFAIERGRRVQRGSLLDTEASYEVVHLDRMPLGTTYPAIIDAVRGLLATPQLSGQTRLIVDATGVGRPVIDAMRAAGLAPTPVTITAGEHASHGIGGYRRVPKRDLVGALAVLLQTGRLQIAAELRHAQTLAEELINFRVRFTNAGNDTYGAMWREGVHDDLVLAVAVAAWCGEKVELYDPSGWSVLKR